MGAVTNRPPMWRARNPAPEGLPESAVWRGPYPKDRSLEQTPDTEPNAQKMGEVATEDQVKLKAES